MENEVIVQHNDSGSKLGEVPYSFSPNFKHYLTKNIVEDVSGDLSRYEIVRRTIETTLDSVAQDIPKLLKCELVEVFGPNPVLNVAAITSNVDKLVRRAHVSGLKRGYENGALVSAASEEYASVVAEAAVHKENSEKYANEARKWEKAWGSRGDRLDEVELSLASAKQTIREYEIAAAAPRWTRFLALFRK